ncbi:hypothetical protein BN59_01716 [Legionella massiliensis]|uniref:Uncharacterized protein n=1 Tax=Legionella massiliensis TaxID=1034943 RepID=A0A078L0B5_9GAMM|nr:hypothetical protein [Legionella massiliensis]CDZ77433.1 hypothetical protein BN59_01716 [Legionella massiliensis]CEE13171.1 hypothetical protein BN1094_01716 [Legionella massiliensis]
MHLVIYFCGTGNPGNNFPGQFDYAPGDGQVRTVFVKGCDKPEVCNNGLFPDLKGFARRFTKKLFGKDKKIATTESKELEGIGISLDRSDIQGVGDEEIESITLCGYSRGAVTCFEVAKELNKIAPTIPVDIVADQPVPGNFYSGPGSNVASVADCSNLNNLRNVSIILGAYTGAKTSVNLSVKLEMPEDLTPYQNSYLLVNNALYYVGADVRAQLLEFNTQYNTSGILEHLEINPQIEGKHSISTAMMAYLTTHDAVEAQHESTDPVHRGFFSQVVPKLPRTAHRDLIVIPRESHHQNPPNTPEGDAHMHMQVAKYLHKQGLVAQEEVQRKTEEARATYTKNQHLEAKPFPVISRLQSFFGLENEKAYRYIDKLHPQVHLRKGMAWNREEALINWWSKQDKKASYFSSQLTKDLVKAIENTQSEDVEQLKNLFQEADSWLIAKEHVSTSRYNQVECLRNNIYDHLVNNLNIDKVELYQLNRQVMHRTGYFQKHWTEGSLNASWFKTDETRTLDRAFEEHAKAEPSEESDRVLLEALETWIEAKKGTQSKRYDLVLEMTEHLQDVIEKCYEQGLQLQHTVI